MPRTSGPPTATPGGLALAIPLTVDSGAYFPERGRLVFIAFSVVLFTLLVQGLTLPWLAKRFQLDLGQDKHEQAVRQLWWRAARAGLDRLGELEEQDRLPAGIADRLRDRQHDRLARLCPEKYAEEEASEAKLRLSQWRAAAEVEQEMIAASRREMLAARGEAGADPELVDQVLRGLDLRSERK